MAHSIFLSPDRCIVLLQSAAHFNIRCYDAKLTVLAGECQLNGHVMSPSTEPLCLNSMDSHSRLSLIAVSTLIADTVKQCLRSNGVAEDSCKITSDCGVVVLVEPSETRTNFLCATYKRLWGETEESALVKMEYFELYAGLEKAVCISNDWCDLVGRLVSAATPCCVAVCGPQNSGKSTLCRHVINSLLGVNKKILFLDTDLGQSEMTHSGLVTLTVLCAPLLNPPYCNKVQFVADLSTDSTHLSSLSYCMGVVSPAQFMSEYLEKVRHIVVRARQLNSTIPLVVNFMGWTKGFGVALHADILRMLEPSHIINLQTGSPKDLPPIPELLEIPGILSPQQHSKHVPEILNLPGHTSTSIPAIQAFELRHLASLNYFSPIYTPSNTVQPPYKLRWGEISVILPETTEQCLAAYTLNCSVVALLSGPENNSENMDVMSFIDKEGPEMKCLGLGIIRAIDVKEKVFYLNTPVDEKTLEDVHVIKHTTLPVPHIPSGALPMPYISNLAASEMLGTGSRSQRANLKRRYEAVS